MDYYYLHKYPFLRLIIPWIAGVFCGDYFFDAQTEASGYIVLFLFLLLLTFGFYFQQRYSLRWCFGASFLGLCFVGGWIGVTTQLEKTVYQFPKTEDAYRIVLTDNPEAKEKTFLCRATLIERHDSTATVAVARQAILYLAKDSLSARLKSGDELLVAARISPPANQGNFDEFDYARYLLRKGISGTGYIVSGKWELLSSKELTTFRSIADSHREKVLALYRDLGFETDELAVLSALTIGDKAELSDSIVESYSVSGASHILALSGLHIGLLYALLFFVIRFPGRWGKAGLALRSVVILLLLWCFAFFTGFSPSVIRSVSMVTLLAVASVIGRKNLSINTLAATAFLMLLCNPVWLFDVGFQLSFLAVAAILYFQPVIYNLVKVKRRVSKYVWGIMSVSIAAQLGTAPLVILYFSRFSTHFLLTNLVVIPLVSLILYTSVAMLLLTPFPFIQSGVAWVVNLFLTVLNSFIRWVEHLPYASMDGIWLHKSEVCLIYLAFILLYISWNNRRKIVYARSLLISLSCLLLLSTVHVWLYSADRPQQSLVFYNVRGCPAVHGIAADGHSWLAYSDNETGQERLHRTASNYWNHHHLYPPTELKGDYKDASFQATNQLFFFGDSRVCMVTDDRWKAQRATSPLRINYLYLCKGCNESLKELTKLFTPTYVLLDTSLSEYRRKSLAAECRQLGLLFISLPEEGSVRFLL